MSRFGDGTLKQAIYDALEGAKYDWCDDPSKGVSLLEFLCSVLEVVADYARELKFYIEEQK